MNSLNRVTMTTTINATTLNAQGNLQYVSGLNTDINSNLIPSETLAEFLRKEIYNSLEEEDKNKTLSKLITSIVINKMCEISEMSEDELIESALYKKLSDSFNDRLRKIEDNITQIQNDLLFIKWKQDQSSDYHKYDYTTTTATSSDCWVSGDSFALPHSKLPTEGKEESMLDKLKGLFGG